MHAETRFLTHNLKNSVTYNQSGELVGIEHAGRRAFNLELVRAMAKIRKKKFTPVVVPFLRGYEMVTTENDYALFNISRNTEREQKVKWVGPLQSDSVYLFENTRNESAIGSFSDLNQYTSVCVLRGSRHQKILEEKARSRLVITNSYDSCFRLLAEERVDLTPVSLLEIAAILKATGLNKEMIRQTPVILYRSEGYIAFSLNTPDAEIGEWQKSLDLLKSSGEYESLKRQYLLSK